jgi:hypothetical protein
LDEAKLLPNNVRPTKDDAGNYTGGLTYSLAGSSRGSSSLEATPTVTRHDEAADSGDKEAAEGDTPGQQG